MASNGDLKKIVGVRVWLCGSGANWGTHILYRSVGWSAWVCDSAQLPTGVHLEGSSDGSRSEVPAIHVGCPNSVLSSRVWGGSALAIADILSDSADVRSDCIYSSQTNVKKTTEVIKGGG